MRDGGGEMQRISGLQMIMTAGDFIEDFPFYDENEILTVMHHQFGYISDGDMGDAAVQFCPFKTAGKYIIDRFCRAPEAGLKALLAEMGARSLTPEAGKKIDQIGVQCRRDLVKRDKGGRRYAELYLTDEAFGQTTVVSHLPHGLADTLSALAQEPPERARISLAAWLPVRLFAMRDSRYATGLGWGWALQGCTPGLTPWRLARKRLRV